MRMCEWALTLLYSFFFLVPYKIFYYSIFDQATMKDTLYNDYIGTKYI